MRSHMQLAVRLLALSRPPFTLNFELRLQRIQAQVGSRGVGTVLGVALRRVPPRASARDGMKLVLSAAVILGRDGLSRRGQHQATSEPRLHIALSAWASTTSGVRRHRQRSPLRAAWLCGPFCAAAGFGSCTRGCVLASRDIGWLARPQWPTAAPALLSIRACSFPHRLRARVRPWGDQGCARHGPAARGAARLRSGVTKKSGALAYRRGAQPA